MTKFTAQKLGDLLTKAAREGRSARAAQYAANPALGNFRAVVHIEADDGSWCELDAESMEHARSIANNWVETQGARGASCRMLRGNSPGSVALKPFYTVYASYTINDDDD